MQMAAMLNLVAKKSDSGWRAMAFFITTKVDPQIAVTPTKASVAANVELLSLLLATKPAYLARSLNSLSRARSLP